MILNNLKRASVYTTIALLAIGGLSSCGSKDKEKAADEQQADSIPTIPVFALQKGILPSVLKIPGELAPYQQVDLYAKISSFVKKVNVDVGSEVQQGQLLMTMDAPEINSQLAEAKSKIKTQEAVYMASKANYDRLYETSKTPGTISGNDLDQASARKNSDEAQLEAAKSAYQAVQANLAYLQIRAPFNAVVSSRNTNPGAYVGPTGKGSDLPLLVLQQQKRLRLIISVPEAYSGILKEKSKVNFTVRSIPGKQFTASVNRMAGALDSKLRSERLEMDVYNNDKTLLPGMYAEVSMSIAPKDSTFIIPRTALVMSTEKVFVIRVVNGKAEWVGVTKGREADGKVEVYGDLKPGDDIVTTANDEIRDGQPVRKK
ncbi:RND family efflux transporter MFP subunit [Mucilaginibacter gracilis]|uniref:RND family efflux transporter MFP subunit n=1 Tax=Mucilaginibacter gracilis TaxID=423350 RepID=A0A495IYM3_9SPHI|nr:efflux RND transporter periplasmic adaptor subunit [Mucilaginibacter gracilis]RKR81481.1 RND family efflux transporter MFP subunit [Mucilaginibacter gracilis]